MREKTAWGAAIRAGAAHFEEFLDRATDEVFSTMMGIGCAPAETDTGSERGSISAVIGLAGALSGSLVLHTSGAAAMRIAEKMTGIDPGEVDGMVRDAIGEVCNMVAGAWKGFDPALASGCLLSTPTVVAGTSYELFSQRAPIRVERSYRFEDLTFQITISCELYA
ncbi:MAG: chemotaxis protein CheX [Acidobacteriaceae bacterium]|jgi:chemotaxis protein CheX